MATNFMKTWSYTEHQDQLYKQFIGRHIFVHSDESTVVVYQTFCSEIADYAVARRFFGGPQFDFDRTTWLKLSFLWTMKKSKWTARTGQERALAIRIDKTFFLELIDMAASNGILYQTPPGRVDSDEVALQWVPDYNARGEQLERHTLLVGLSSYMMRKLNNSHIIDIADITDFTTEQYSLVQSNDYSGILVPTMEQLVPANEETCAKIMLHGFYKTPEEEELDQIIEIESLRKSKKRRREVALFLQGSFNPVHTRHVQIMKECKSWVEKMAKRKVIVGVMGVNPDKMLNDKINKHEDGEGLVITEEHRLEMCRLATLPYEWIHVQIHHEGHTKDDNLKHIVGNHTKWFYIFGADKMIRRDISKRTHTLIIGRQGVDLHLTKERTKAATQKDVHLIPVELENVSSTEIRRELKHMSCMDTREEKQIITEQLVEKGWLDACVADYLIDNERDLYEYSTA